MAPPSDDSKGSAYTVRSGLLKEYAEDRYNKQMEQRDRWMAEHQHREAIEKGLRDVGKFVYDPVDYVRMLVREPFKEPSRSDFSYILPDRMTAAERRFRRPINIRWALMALPMVIFAAFPMWGTFFVCALFLVIMGFVQYRLLSEREKILAQTEKDARAEVEALVRAEEAKINDLKKLHERNEEDRIDYHVRLLNGDTGAVMLRLDETLPKMRFPFPLKIVVDVHDRVLLAHIWFPSKSLIPKERTSLNESGRIEYTKKESIEVNKQYAELCAAIVVQVIMTVFSVLPNLSKAYFKGLATTNDGGEECLISVVTERYMVERVARASTALVAVQGLAGKYQCDEFLKLMPIEAVRPLEWSEVSDREIRNLHIKIE